MRDARGAPARPFESRARPFGAKAGPGPLAAPADPSIGIVLHAGLARDERPAQGEGRAQGHRDSRRISGGHLRAAEFKASAGPAPGLSRGLT